MGKDSLREKIEQDVSDNLSGFITGARWENSKVVSLGAAGLSAAIVLFLTQTQSLTHVLEIALFCVSLAIPVWLSCWQIGDTYSLYGEVSYNHFFKLKNFLPGVVLFLAGCLLLFVSFALIVWNASKGASVAFIALSLVLAIYVSMHSVSVRKHVERNRVKSEKTNKK